MLTTDLSIFVSSSISAEAICDAIEKLYNDRAFALEIAKNNLKEVEKYHPDKVMAEFYCFTD